MKQCSHFSYFLTFKSYIKCLGDTILSSVKWRQEYVAAKILWILNEITHIKCLAMGAQNIIGPYSLIAHLPPRLMTRQNFSGGLRIDSIKPYLPEKPICGMSSSF